MADRTSIRIVFMGTPDFAVSSLAALLAAGYQVVGVVTAPDKLAGRGMKLQESAVKQFAIRQGIPVLQPQKLKDPDFLSALRAMRADLQVVVAFRMLPEIVWSMPPMGTVNVHGSLLPQYRGAAPINWAVIFGDTETGVTTFQLQHAIDTGHILLQRNMQIGPNDTAGDVHDRMKTLGAALLVETIDGLLEGKITPRAQSELDMDQLRHAPKIFTETCRIDWTKSAKEIHQLIRGLSPYPAAFTLVDGKIWKILQASFQVESITQVPGVIDTDGKSYLRFSCRDGWIHIQELQVEGKKRLSIEDFLRGYRMKSV
jgi:methionyl-tRNA formyltransferase